MRPLHVKNKEEMRDKVGGAISQSGSAWRHQKWKLALYLMCVGVNLSLKCSPDAWKVLFLELEVNCQRTSKL